MPYYDYYCDSCTHDIEIFQSMSDDVLTVCPHCSAITLRRVISGVGLIFKGSGFYVTDNKQNVSTSSAAPKSTDSE